MYTMPLIPLYGYIENPNHPEVGEPFYILKENQLSPTLFEYRGLIGHGYHEGFFLDEDHTSDQVINDDNYPVKFIKSDMREFVFTFDTEKNLVTIETYWRYEVHEEEAKSLKKNLESDYIDDDEDREISYPYFRFPRTKEGIAVSRAMNRIFENRDIKIFLPKKHLG